MHFSVVSASQTLLSTRFTWGFHKDADSDPLDSATALGPPFE